MKTVWKYPILLGCSFSLAMPKGAEILTFQMRDGVATIWALVQSENEQEIRNFQWVGTGQPIKGAGIPTHIGTYQLHFRVLHLFEMVDAKKQWGEFA